MKSRYGIIYQGSKNTIAEDILNVLPKGNRLVDLFGGGGAITHCALLKFLDKFQKVLYNDIDNLIVQLFKNTVIGKEAYIHPFITREKFFKKKELSGYIKFMWSFAQNGTSYLYGRKKYKYIKSFYNFLLNGKVCKGIVKLFPYYKDITIDNYTKIVKKYLDEVPGDSEKKELLNYFYRVQSIQHDKGLISLYQSLKGVDLRAKLHITNVDYKEYEYKLGDIVYCDIPYESTRGYSNNFDQKDFYSYVKASRYPIYFSSYEKESLPFQIVFRKKKREQSYSQRLKYNIECLYVGGGNK